MQLSDFSRLSLFGLARLLGSLTLASLAQGRTALESTPYLGINIDPVADWSGEWVYTNVFRRARPWIPQEADGWTWDTGQPLALNAQGWPLLAEGQAAGTLMCRDLDGHYPGGVYTCLFEGSGVIQFGFDAEVIGVESGRLLVNVTPSSAGIYLKVVESDVQDPIRNIRMLMPGFEHSQNQKFHPLFLERLRGFGTLRFMDWQRTNNSALVHWEDRARPDDYTQASPKGVALEEMIDLCNTLRCDGWFNIPHQADNEYVQHMAELLQERLNPSLKAYIEYSNEVWNSQFEQAAWCEAQGLAMGLSNNGLQARLYFQSRRSVEIFGLFDAVFENDARVVRVIGSQSANPWISTQLLDHADAYQHADALAIAPYFGGFLGQPSQAPQTMELGVEGVLDACAASLDGLFETVAEQASAAHARELELVAYEGGQHLVGVGAWAWDEEFADLLISANRDPRMGELYEDYLARWRAAGGGSFMAFSSCQRPSIYGSFGSMEYQDQPIETAYKFRALRRALYAESGLEPLSYCAGEPNSSGQAATLASEGTTSVVLSDLSFTGSDLPVGELVVFYAGTTQMQAPFGDGWLCIDGPLTRLGARIVDPQGGAALALDRPTPHGRELSVGESWYAQAWYRDPSSLAAGFNTSNALVLTVAP